MGLRTVNVTRYISPLREGGSLPALAEADDDFKYVVKFKGAGHGSKALIAELIGGEIARLLSLKIPELVFINLEEAFGRMEPDEEIQDLLRASKGLNLGLHYLSSAITFDPIAFKVDSALASKIVWLDAFLTNIDRTVKNTNMLVWHKELWLIDQGASLYFHHSWVNWEKLSITPFSQVKDHVLLPLATQLEDADIFAKKYINEESLKKIVNLIPEEWINPEDFDENIDQVKSIYLEYLLRRLNHTQIFIKEAQNARKTLI